MSQKRNIDFELNLLPVISVLAVCICFLLSTAVWVHLGTIDSSQAFGEGAHDPSQQNPPSINVTVTAEGDLQILLRDLRSGKSHQQFKVSHSQGRINWSEIQNTLSNIIKNNPEIQTGLVIPQNKVKYSDVIRVMDELKKQNIHQLGVSPS